MQVNMHEAKTHLSRLVASLEAGDVDEVEIARDGVTVARLVPPSPHKPRVPGKLAGRIRIGADFDDPLPPDILQGFGLSEP